MNIFKRYVGIIDGIDMMILIDADEIASFIVHFGQFGNIYIWDILDNQIIIDTKGIYLNKFYPDIKNRELAEIKAKEIFYLFKDYKYQKKRKYPKGKLKKIYKVIKMYAEINDIVNDTKT